MEWKKQKNIKIHKNIIGMLLDKIKVFLVILKINQYLQLIQLKYNKKVKKNKKNNNKIYYH